MIDHIEIRGAPEDSFHKIEKAASQPMQLSLFYWKVKQAN